MSAYLVIQNELRKSKDKEKGDSFNITMVEFDRSTGIITDAPLSIWQSTYPDNPGGDVPEIPFITEVDLGVRQFNGKDGRQTSVYVKAFKNCEHLKIEGITPPSDSSSKKLKPPF